MRTRSKNVRHTDEKQLRCVALSIFRCLWATALRSDLELQGNAAYSRFEEKED
jgi:hypothetical protein